MLHAGALNWQKINPDIFGSMIQAVTNDDDRGSLGMHYTSVPNILKVLNPLFLEDLNDQLEASKESPLKLFNLRKRIARMRVFDPACGSGNFLVIAYKELRKIEAKINELRGEKGRATDIPLTNFRGIEINSFPAEIARLALVIAEYQSNVQYCGQIEALQTVLPLSKENWIICGNALRLDWLSICPPTGSTVKVVADDLFETLLDQPEFDFENEGGETYICGNPPYKGSREQLNSQKEDLVRIFKKSTDTKILDYVCGWLFKAAEYIKLNQAESAFVTTNSVCQGQHVPSLWPLILEKAEITFALNSFKWSNLASDNAGVTVSIIGLGNKIKNKRLYYETNGSLIKKIVKNISPYLTESENFIVEKSVQPISELPTMNYGNYPGDGNFLSLTREEKESLLQQNPSLSDLIKPLFGGQEFIKGKLRYCLWINDCDLPRALENDFISQRISQVESTRLISRDKSLNKLANRPHQYRDRNFANVHSILIPTVSSEKREYLPCDLKNNNAITTNQAFALFDSPLWSLSLLSSKLHLVWIGAVCGKLETRYRYSNVLGWNTFPVPKLTEKNKADLTHCAENILLARETHFPATIADLYDPKKMPENLRAAHEKNDEVLERIYIGRRFKNDTERLEKLFSMYTEMTSKQAGKK